MHNILFFVTYFFYYSGFYEKEKNNTRITMRIKLNTLFCIGHFFSPNGIICFWCDEFSWISNGTLNEERVLFYDEFLWNIEGNFKWKKKLA